MVQVLINNNELTNIASAEFNDTLNEINKAEINLTAQDSVDITNAQIDAEIDLLTSLKNYKFKIINRVFIEGGNLKLICLGIEEVFANVDIDVSNLSNASTTTARAGVYNSIAVNTIFSDLISHISGGWTVNSTLTETISNIRFDESMSVWNAFSKLANQQGYEIDIDYDNLEIIIESNLGNNQVEVLNEGLDFEGIPTFSEERAKAKKVIVYGKGDGVFQIKATATDGAYSVGDPTIKFNDPNILTEAQAQQRADLELSKLKQTIKHYTIPSIQNFSFSLSDTILINSPSVGLEDEELKIVKIILFVSGNNFSYNVEVTNAEYSRAFKSTQQKINEQRLMNRDKNLTNQGSGNTLNWARGLNANSTAPLRTVFYIPEDYISESGDLEIASLRVDYEVEPFREGSGSASEDDVSPSLTAGTQTDSHKHDVSEDGQHRHTNPTETSQNTRIIDNDASNSVSTTNIDDSWTEIDNETLNENYDVLFFNLDLNLGSRTGSGPLYVRVQRGSTTIIQEELISDISNGAGFIKKTLTFATIANSSGFNYDVDLICGFSGADIDVSGEVQYYGLLRNHSHTIDEYLTENENILVDENNKTPGVTGNAQSHNHNVVIGSAVGDAELINADSVSLYLDYWNGSDWINKHSVLNTGNLLDTNVDISNNGQFPDTFGYWRVRTLTNSADADFVETIVRMKHNLSNR